MALSRALFAFRPRLTCSITRNITCIATLEITPNNTCKITCARHCAATPAERKGRLLDGLGCHHTWLAFFTELWDTVCDRTDGEHSAVVQSLTRMLQHSLAHPQRLSNHPAAAAPRFRLLLLALRFARNRMATLGGGGVPLALVLLHDRVVNAGLAW